MCRSGEVADRAPLPHSLGVQFLSFFPGLAHGFQRRQAVPEFRFRSDFSLPPGPPLSLPLFRWSLVSIWFALFLSLGDGHIPLECESSDNLLSTSCSNSSSSNSAVRDERGCHGEGSISFSIVSSFVFFCISLPSVDTADQPHRFAYSLQLYARRSVIAAGFGQQTATAANRPPIAGRCQFKERPIRHTAPIWSVNGAPSCSMKLHKIARVEAQMCKCCAAIHWSRAVVPKLN